MLYYFRNTNVQDAQTERGRERRLQDLLSFVFSRSVDCQPVPSADMGPTLTELDNQYSLQVHRLSTTHALRVHGQRLQH